MSNVTIQILKPVDVTKPQVGKNYQQMVVTHTDLSNNKTDGKKLFDFTTPKDVWNTLLNAKPMQTFEVTRQKDAKQGKFWEWVGIKEVDASAPTSAPTSTTSTGSAPATSTPATTARVGNWETPEERAAKQHYIVRQSSITAALTFHEKFGVGEDVPSLADVLDTARRFEDFVFGQKGVAGLTNDIPE